MHYDVVFSSNNLAPSGTGLILNLPFNCEGTETTLQQCVPRAQYSESCLSHSGDVGIRCVAPGWGGLVFPADSSRSILKYVTIRDAGYKSSWPNTDDIINGEAISIYLYHHVFENIRVVAPAHTGIQIFHMDPFFKGVVLSISIHDCNPYGRPSKEHGMRFYSQNEISLDFCNIYECHTGIGITAESIYTHRLDILKYVDYTGCNVNMSLDIDDIIILSPPSASVGMHTCNDIFTTVVGAHIAVFVFYKSDYSTITVQEDGNTKLHIDDRLDSSEDGKRLENHVISVGFTVTLHRSTTRTYSHEYMILIKAVNGK